MTGDIQARWPILTTILRQHQTILPPSLRVWERGSGVTMACGTGACASVMAAIAAKLFHYDETVSVLLDGGTLKIQIAPDNTVQMTGPAETVYEGETEIC